MAGPICFYQDFEGGPGPTAAPDNGSVSFYAGNKLKVSWTNGDGDSGTQIGRSDSDTTIPTSADFTVSPGVTEYETGQTDQTKWYWVRHIRNSLTSGWHLCDDGFTPGPEE